MSRTNALKPLRRGFTLIELLIVMTILGICGAVTVCAVGSRSDLVVSAAARSVMADLTYAQTRAISCRKKVFISQTSNQYSLMSRDNDAASLAVLTNPLSHDAYNVAFNGAAGPLNQVNLSGWNFSSSIFGFDELGCPFNYNAANNTTTSMTSAGSFTLASGNAKVSITVQPFTGEMTAE